MQIEVTLAVFKQLTARLAYEGQTHSDVIEELLDRTDTNLEFENPENAIESTDHRIHLKQAERGGFASRKLWLPSGTRLRAYYRQKEYSAYIDNNAWIDESGERHSSPSAAARAITGNNVNGLRFWQALRPDDRVWHKLEALPIK